MGKIKSLSKYIFEIVLLVYGLFFFLYLSKDMSNHRIKKICGLFLIVIVFAAGCYIIRKCQDCIEKRFVILYIVFCVAYMIALPPMKTADETAHYYRSYEISQMKLLAEQNDYSSLDGMSQVGDFLPYNLIPSGLQKNPIEISINDVMQVKGEKINHSIRQWYGFSNTALYAPTSYLPQAFGIKMADLVSDNCLILMYAGRIMNCIIIGVLLYFAIALLPFGKNILTLIAFTPIMLQSCISMSPDGLAFSLSSLLFSFVLYLRYKKTDLRKSDIVLIYLLIVLLCLCKIVYVPVCIALFLLPKGKFRSNKKYYLNVIIATFVIVIISGGWLAITSNYFVEFRAGVDIPAQVSFILHQPMSFLYIIQNTIDLFGTSLLFDMFGQQLGWLDINLSFTLIFLFIAVFVTFVFLDNDIEQYEDYKVIRIVSGMVFVITTMAIITALYVQWNAVGASSIEGIQGRYFLPVLLMLALAIKPKLDLGQKKCFNKEYAWELIFAIQLLVVIALL